MNSPGTTDLFLPSGGSLQPSTTGSLYLTGIVHVYVTTNPGVQWTAQKIINAFPYEKAARFLIRDRDDVYGDPFTRRVEGKLARALIPTGYFQEGADRTSARSPGFRPAAGDADADNIEHRVANERGALSGKTQYLDIFSRHFDIHGDDQNPPAIAGRRSEGTKDAT